jgi:ATP-dependent DNA ligase
MSKKCDPYDVGDDMLALFQKATREALRALDQDVYMAIIDGEIVTVRRAKIS